MQKHIKKSGVTSRHWTVEQYHQHDDPFGRKRDGEMRNKAKETK